jgi:hypothetical protein
VCSIKTNKTFDRLIANNKLLPKKDALRIEKRLICLAKEASIQQAGGLDDPSGKLKHMPEGLRDVSHIRIGRHRVYYTGHHRQCNYFAFYLKCFKKNDVDNEGAKKFQNKMKQWLNEPMSRALYSPEGE